MRGSKTRRVSWVADPNLCQVRLFLNDEAPSLVGLGIQDHLQVKTLTHPHSAATSSKDNLPPGFEGVQASNLSNNLLLEIPTLKWKHPPKLTVNKAWHVAAGEESQEVEAENHRGLRVFEAIYPRQSSIPPNPVISVDVNESQNDHQQPPSIPITPIEEEDIVVDPPNGSTTSKQIGYHDQKAVSGNFSTPVYAGHKAASGSSSDRLAAVTAPIGEPDVVAAASAAYNAMMKANDPGNMIDPELLVQILSDRNLVEKLANGYCANSLQAPPQNFTPVNPSASLSDQNTRARPAVSSPSPNGPFYYSHQSSNVVQPHVQGPHSAPNPPQRDLNYYKSLIQQHGEDRPVVPQQFVGLRPNSQYGLNQDRQQSNPQHKRDSSKAKIMKPCNFFNSPRGCKNGINCPYQHDASLLQRSMPDSKRMKMDSEITGA